MTNYVEEPAWVALVADCYKAKDERLDPFEKLLLVAALITEGNTVKTDDGKQAITTLGDVQAIFCADHDKPILLRMQAEPKDSGFDYAPGGSGFQFPIDEIGALLFYDAADQLVFGFYGLSLTFAELLSFKTLGELTAALFTGDDQMSLQGFNHIMHGFTGNDRIFSGDGHDLLFGDDGNDTVSGGGGSDEVSGGKGDDTLSGGIGKDKLTGEAGADRLDGGSENDDLSGGGGADTLIGWTGKDKMVGGAGNDTLYGYSGADTMTGGGGADKFVYNGIATDESGPAKAAQDIITDFRPGTDDIDLSFMLGAAAFKYIGEKAAFTGANQVRWEHIGPNTVVSISSDADPTAEITITLKGTLDLTKADFIL